MYVASTSPPRPDMPRRAIAAAELALLMPTLVLLALGTLDVCRLFYGCITLANSARNGALYASGNSGMELASPYYSASDADFTAGTLRAVRADAGNLSPSLADGDISLTYATSYDGTYSSTRPATIDSTHDGYARVTISWTYTTTISYPGISNSWSVSRSATVRMVP